MTDAPGPYREESLRQALATDPRVMEQELDVSIAGGRVVISGTVPTEDRRAAVTEVARERRYTHPPLSMFVRHTTYELLSTASASS